MFCENCGNQSSDTDNFCSKCGNKIIRSLDPQKIEPELSKPKESKMLTTGNKKSGKYILWYSLIGIMVLGSFSAIMIPGLAGKGADVDGKSFMALSAWIGVAFAIRAKQKGKSGWLWFFIGFIGVGSILTLVISFLLAFVKS